MERFAEIGGLEMEEVRELRDHLEKIPDPPDGIHFRLPYRKYKQGWDDGTLALFVDRGLATQLYRHAKPDGNTDCRWCSLLGLSPSYQ